MDKENIKALWNEALLDFGIPAISKDTCAKIFAVVLIYGGGNENFTFCDSLRADLAYIQRRFKVDGAETPDADFIELVKKYKVELESHEREAKEKKPPKDLVESFKEDKPQWAKDLFNEMYNIKL